MLGALSPAVAEVADGATVQINALEGNDFDLPLTQNTQLLTPLSPTDRQKIFLFVTQGPGGPWTLSYSAAWIFSPGLPAPTLSTAEGDTDVLCWCYREALGGWLFFGSVEGYS
jgi:hypothetical protein